MKIESDVGMLLLANETQKQAACRDGAYWFTEHNNKLYVGYVITRSSVMKPHNNPWLDINEPGSNPLHQ